VKAQTYSVLLEKKHANGCAIFKVMRSWQQGKKSLPIH